MLEIFKLEDTQKEHLHCLYCGQQKPKFSMRINSKIAEAYIASSICESCLNELKSEFNQEFKYLCGLRDTEVSMSCCSAPTFFPPLER
ncbi:MAG: hypothetical protein OSJ27_09470 [Candidatus Gastranaerophilales bacterium]|nr:hypothetical protein [Candidatus Gastranaerophilales bacterium]